MTEPRQAEVPRALRDRRLGRTLLVVGIFGAYSFQASAVRGGLEASGLGGTAALVAAAAITLGTIAPMVVIVFVAWTSDYRRARMPNPTRFGVALALPAGCSLFFYLRFRYSLSTAGTLVAAVAYAGSLLIVVRRQIIAREHARVHRLIWIDEPVQAEELVAECRDQLRDPRVTGDARASVELNLANGLITLSTLSGRHDGLPEAQRILDGVFGEGRPGWVVAGAISLSWAMIVKAGRSGDDEGLAAALDLLRRAATAPPQIRGVLGQALVLRANGLAVLSSGAEAAGDEELAERLAEEALGELENALLTTPRWSKLHAQWTIELVSTRAVIAPGDDLDASIERCRAALRRLLVHRFHAREGGYLALVDMLITRAAADPDGGANDLVEAVALCRRIVERGREGARATGNLALLLNAVGADRSEVADAYRKTFAAHAPSSLGEAADVAAEWSEWAVESGDPAEAAEAHWNWIRSVAEDARRRLLRSAQERELAAVQGLAANAGFWLLAAGRPTDAAVALDLGRAVQLTERMHRRRDGLEWRLVEAGHTKLANRWREVCERIDLADRAEFDATFAPPMSTIELGTGRFEARFSSSGYEALAEHEQLLQEIGRLPGFDDLQASPSYEDLREAAGQGPVVYLAATPDCGFAVIVTADTSAPKVVALPGLTSDAVDRAARRLVGAQADFEVAERLAEAMTWLWPYFMRPLTQVLPPGAIVTLIPVGALGLLPLHAAGVTRDDHGGWHDQTDGRVFRYAPNARVLRHAQATARRLGSCSLSLLTVAAPSAPGADALPNALLESGAVAAQFGGETVKAPSSASVLEVLEALPESSVWHFACHGDHFPEEPLESCLRLVDGPLTLRTMFGRPAGKQRLAVLSACQTALASEALLDEVISFPSALLQAGVAGVISSHAVVSDRAAMLLVLRFFQYFRLETDPPRALALAQDWLRTATNKQINAAFPAVYAFPADLPEEMRSYWDSLTEFAEPHFWAVFSYSGA